MRSVLAAVAALGICAGAAGAQQDSTSLSVEAIYGRHAFAGASLPDIHWLADGSAYVTTRSGPGGDDIVRVDPASGRTTVLVDAATLARGMGKPAAIEDIVLSDDGSKALVFHNSVRVWRQNTRGAYHVVDFRTGRVTPVSRRPGLQMFAKFSPDGRQVAFARDGDLWVTDLATGEERALTTDGSDVIINGTTDWAYEEELDLRDAFRWSPDSRRILFWRFDQSAIPTYPLLDDDSLYPRVRSLRYPKAGEPNSTVKLGVVTVATGATTWLHTGGDTTAYGDYLARAEWAGADSIVVQRLPRLQNRIDVLMASATTGGTRPLLTERASAWLEVEEGSPTWVDGGRAFIWASERSGWTQYYLYRRDGTLVRRITRDSVDATALAGVDAKRRILYVVEAGPTPMQRQLVAYDWRKTGAARRVTRQAGTHRVSIAPGGGWMVDIWTAANIPPVTSVAALPAAAHSRTIEGNDALRSAVARLGLRAPEFFQLPMPDGTTLDAYRIVPAGFDSTRRYPVLMTVYGGPGSQTVTDDWGGANYLWHQMLARRGLVVVSVDNRGTGARGTAFRDVTYQHLGLRESQDQIDAARWLAKQPWVDGSRIGIWGWSYGGYMAAMTAFRGGDVFRAAISVAPVTDWRLYDAIYTERYMRTPRENPTGYAESSPQRYVSGLTASYLLVHGTGDDNVHPQNTIQLIDRLVAAGKPFQLMLYPNRTHSIAGGNTRVHLFDLLTSFVEEHLVGTADGAATAADGRGAR